MAIVSMLVSVLVDRYQRVYTRKRFLTEDYTDKILFSDPPLPINRTGECLESQVKVNNECNNNEEVSNEIEETESNDRVSGKVRFIIGYVSGEDTDDDTEADNDKDN